MLDDRTVRGIVLGILRAYSQPSEKSENEIEAILPLLQHAPNPNVRNQAATCSRLWMATKGRDPIRYRKLIFYRLRLLDHEIENLEKMTRPKTRGAT
jgi:hypothetical protein